MKAQIAAGLEVAGVTGVRQNQHGYVAEAPLETAEGLDFFRTLTSVQGPTPLREWREVSALAQRVEEAVNEWKPDILHAHSPALNGLAGLRAAQRSGLPLVYEIRAFWEDAAVGNGTGTEGSPKYWLTRQLENHVVANADAVAVICEGLRGDLIQRGVDQSKIIVSPNGVDMALFGNPPEPDAKMRAELKLEGKSVLGFIGSFYDYEGLDDLVAAMAFLIKQRPDTHLLLVGGGPREEALKAQVAELELTDAVTFTGRVPHEEVERYYSLMDVMVYPRKSMRLTDLVTPLKPLEAMAQGRMVAASDVGGHRELIQDRKTGILFAADAPEKQAEKLAEMLNTKGDWSQIIENAKKFVSADRNWSSNILRYNPVYQKLIAQKSGAKSALNNNAQAA